MHCEGTVESLREELRAAGQDPDAVQRNDGTRVLKDGVYLVRPAPDGVSVTFYERGVERFPEVFLTEQAAMAELRRRLFAGPTGQKLSEEDRAAVGARMQAKARATLERLAREQRK